jgi:hypothetical protein
MNRTRKKSEIQRYLASVQERDIDLLLMEEFHVTDEFVSWYCGRLGLGKVTPNGAWHSVSDKDGETDLFLCVHAGGHKVGVLIENKIAAAEQEKQAERYHVRGMRMVADGKIDSYIVAICAPQAYLNGLSPNSGYQYRVPYEEIAKWFEADKEKMRRAAWRYRIMNEAIEQG